MMFKRLLLSFMFVCSLTSYVYAQEVISEFSEQTLPVLNEELGGMRSDIKEALDFIGSGQTSLQTQVTGTLPLENGGLGVDLSGILLGEMLVGTSPGVIGTLGTGTSGYVLTANGTSAIPSYQDPLIGASIVDLGSWSSTNGEVVSITIAEDKQYILVVHAWNTAAGTDTDFGIRFNSDSANNYTSYLSTLGSGGLTTNTNATDYIKIGGANRNQTYGVDAIVYISTYDDMGSSYQAKVYGSYFGHSHGHAPSNTAGNQNLWGYYNQATTLSSMELYADAGTCSGRYWLYILN